MEGSTPARHTAFRYKNLIVLFLTPFESTLTQSQPIGLRKHGTACVSSNLQRRDGAEPQPCGLCCSDVGGRRAMKAGHQEVPQCVTQHPEC